MKELFLGLALCMQVYHSNSCYHAGIIHCDAKERTSISKEVYCVRCSNDEKRYVCKSCYKYYHIIKYSKNIEDNYKLFLSGKYEPWKDICYINLPR